MYFQRFRIFHRNHSRSIFAQPRGRRGNVSNLASLCLVRAMSTLPIKVPKIVREISAKLKNEPITKANVQAKVGKKEWNNLCTTFRTSLPDELKQKYKSLGSDDLRADWVGQWAMDPQGAVASGFNRKVVHETDQEREQFLWLTEDQLGGPEHLNNVNHAKLVIEGGDLGEGRPHELPSLAKAGVVQYPVTKTWLEKAKGTTKEAGVSLRAELTAEEYEEVSRDMAAGVSKAVPKKKATPKVVDPEAAAAAKLLKAANAKLAPALRSLKRKCDAVLGDCDENILHTIPKLAKKATRTRCKPSLSRK